MNNSINKGNRFFCIYTSVILVFTSWVIYYSLPIKHVFEVLLALSILYKYHDFSIRNQKIYLFFVLISLWYYRPEYFDAGVLATGIYKSIIFGLIFFIPPKSLSQIFVYFRYILVILVVYGAVFHILRILGIFSLPQIATVISDNRYYDVYPFLVYQTISAMRFASIFDEPGYLGTIIAFVLVLGNLDFKKWYNIILLIGGILTLSLAFYAILALVLGIYIIKKRAYYILFIIGILIFLINIYLPEFFIPFLERNEMAIFFGGEYSDNRGDSSKSIQFINSMPFINILIGNGYDAPLRLFHDNTDGLASSSIWRMILQMGYLGVMSLIIFILKYTKRDFTNILFAIVFIISLYQRPHIFEMIFIFFLACGFNNLKYANNK